VNDDEGSLFMAWRMVIVTYNVRNKTPESIFQITPAVLPFQSFWNQIWFILQPFGLFFFDLDCSLF